MTTVNAHRYDLYVNGFDEKTLSAFAEALEKTRLDECIIQSPDEPGLFTSEAMDVEWRNGLYEETIEDALHNLAIQFPDLKLHFVAEDLDDRGQGYELKFQGDLYQRANLVSTLTEFSVPTPFDQRQESLLQERARSIKVNDLLENITKHTDYDLLYAQKLALLDALNTGTPIPKQALEGLINFLDNMGDLGEAMGRFQYDGMEPPYPMQPDYQKKVCVFPPEPEPKMHILCEEFEDDGGIREFTILGVSRDKEGLQKMMRAKIEKDEYGYIAENGVREESGTHFSTEFDEGFVKYYILEEDILSREQTQALLDIKEYDPTFHYPDGFSLLLTEEIHKIAVDEGYGEIHAEKAAEYFMEDKSFRAELRDTYWYHPDRISDEQRARQFCFNFVCDELEENPELFADLGLVPVFKAPDNFQETLIASIYDASKDLRLATVHVQQICEECLHNGGFRAQVTEKFGSIQTLDESTMPAAATFCYAFLMDRLRPEQEKAHPGLDQIIAGAANRTTPASAKAEEKEKEQSR